MRAVPLTDPPLPKVQPQELPAAVDTSPYNKDVFINANHLDYLGDDGYLYIMGRSKDGISSGGHLISPFEVEKAIMAAASSSSSSLCGRVTEALIFAVSHDILDEVPAVVLVPTPGQPRVDVKTLHSALRATLSQSKWPLLIVYMDSLPRRNSKVLRIKLAERLGLPRLTDNTPYLARHWEASCPAPDTSLSAGIPSSQCWIDRAAIISTLDSVIPSGFQAAVRIDPHDGSLEALLAPKVYGTPPLASDWVNHIRRGMSRSIHHYMIPNNIHFLSEPFPEDPLGVVDEDRLQETLDKLHFAEASNYAISTEGRIIRAFAQILLWDPGKIDASADFWALGGDETQASELLALLREDFKIHLPAGFVFNHGTVKAISTYIDATIGSTLSRDGLNQQNTEENFKETRSSRNKWLMALQLLPLTFFYPMRRSFQWTFFLSFLSLTRFWLTNNFLLGRFFNLTFSIFLGWLILQILGPICGILAKWVIIGRYKAGVYPMWGGYHTRWWLVQKIVSLSGSGVFNINGGTRAMYYRLMGAKIGKNVSLLGASVGEWDLLDIRDGATLAEGSIIRPFAVEANTTMVLGPIQIGKNACVGVGSVIPPNTVIEAEVCMGPNSSSWEMRDADESNRDLLPSQAPEEHWALYTFLTLPILALGHFFMLIPWLVGLFGLIRTKADFAILPLRIILGWFPKEPAVGFHYLALVLRSSLSPIFLFLFTVFVRWLMDAMFGKLGPGTSKSRSNIQIWRANLIKHLLPEARLQEFTEIFGQNHEATSISYRMLGAKVGKRVHWPYVAPMVSDYHLLDIGNDVTIGPRTKLITTDGVGSEKIYIRDGAMIDDRVCLLPGVEIGECSMVGTAALARRGGVYPAFGTYIGARGGDCISWLTGWNSAEKKKQSSPTRIPHMASTDTLVDKTLHHIASTDTLVDKTVSMKKSPSVESGGAAAEKKARPDSRHPRNDAPFDRAFYHGEAPYYVFGQFTIFCYSAFFSIFTAFYWNIPVICAVKVVGAIFNRWISDDFDKKPYAGYYYVVYLFILCSLSACVLTSVQSALTVALVIFAKRALLGRQLQPGHYDWDKSNYCQRRQLFLIIERLIHRCYRSQGIPIMLSGTHWLVLYYRALGATIGDDCALFANGRPNFMFTEPDLIVLGDRVAMDDVNLRAHHDVRGKFELERVEIGDRCVLRTGSSMLCGATMKSDSCLLEHTLIMGGDVVEKAWTMQGWPAERFYGSRLSPAEDAKIEEAQGARNNSDATLVNE